jgi:glycosyltransferase involved in cell wall biosynthesis
MWNFQQKPNIYPPFDTLEKVYGGTEFMIEEVRKIIKNLYKFSDYNCVSVPGVFHTDEIDYNKKPVIMWMHNNLNQLNKASTIIVNKYQKKTKAYIVPSEECKLELIKNVKDIDISTIFVIPHAINPLNYNPDKFKNVSKIEIIHVSAPERGMDLLLKSLKYVDHDFNLRIFNSFSPDIRDGINWANSAPKDDRVIFYGRTPRKTVYKYFENAHIHAYPSTYNETFCLSQVEAMSAGCLCVYKYNKENAIRSVSGGFGIGYEDKFKDPKIFAEHLNSAIEMVKNKQFDPTEQIDYVNTTFSWEKLKENWTKLEQYL